jgi:protein arginine kinase activator
MLCDRCGQREATHHDLRVDGSEVRETHLCESCAQAAASGGAAPASLGEWLTNFELAPPVPLSSGSPENRSAASCPSCGLTFAELKKTGLVGCESCYGAFEARLTPLLQRAHDGGARHTGKRPSHAGARRHRESEPAGVGAERGAPLSVSEQVERLRAELEEAVSVEAYEEAARLRDRLDRLLRGEPDAADEGHDAPDPEGGAS